MFWNKTERVDVLTATKLFTLQWLLWFSCPCDPMDSQLTRLLCPWDSPGKNTGMGSHSLLQGIFLTQGLNPHHLLCRQILYHWQAPRKAHKIVTFMLGEFPLNKTHTHTHTHTVTHFPEPSSLSSSHQFLGSAPSLLQFTLQIPGCTP